MGWSQGCGVGMGGGGGVQSWEAEPLTRSDRPDNPANQSRQWVSVSGAFSDNPDKVYALLLLSGLSGLSDIF